jgi:hypothetical protein
VEEERGRENFYINLANKERKKQQQRQALDHQNKMLWGP